VIWMTKKENFISSEGNSMPKIPEFKTKKEERDFWETH